jgi:hypothetical protein
MQGIVCARRDVAVRADLDGTFTAAATHFEAVLQK